MKPALDLKDALLEIVSCMLSPNAEVRRIAEERKKALEVTEEYALHLLEILLTAEEALEERQMATILLRQYVQFHWNDLYEDCVPPIATNFVKEKIRSVLPMGLSDSIKRIRSHIAHILANIAADDYPHAWPEMCESIFLRLDYSTVDAVGIIEFINDFSRMASRPQINRCAQEIYNVLFIICKDNKKYSTKIRSEAVFSLANFVSIHCMDNKEQMKLGDTVKNFCEVLAHQLTLPHPEESDFILKSQILKTYSYWLIHIPDSIGKTLVNILPTIWQILSRCGELNEEMLINESMPYRDPSENPEDTPLFYTLTYGIFELVCNLLTNQQATLQITMALPDLMYYMLLFMGIPKEVEVLWKSDPEIYLADDFSNSNSSVRLKARELLVLMASKLDARNFQLSFSKAVEKHVHISKSKSESYYWRTMEAVMYSVGSISKFIITLYNKKELTDFDIMDYLNKWAEDIGPCPAWLLLARIMWVGGKFAILLKSNTISTYVMTTVHNLHESSFILRYSAIRALSFHLSCFMTSNYYLLYMEIRDPIAHALIDALEQSQGYIIRVGLFALENLLKPEPPIIEPIQNKLITLMQHLFLQNITNAEVISDLCNIVKHVSNMNSCYKNLESRFLPIITNIITNNVNTEGNNSCAFEAHRCAIEFLSTIVKNSPEPLSNELIRYGFFGVYNCMITVNDSGITQSGADCLRSFLCKASSQIIQMRDNGGTSGGEYILSILRYVIDPDKIEFSCKQVGLLSITAMNTLGLHLDEHISFLLRGVLSSMQRANSVSVEESLLVIFAYLFYNRMESVINYLTLIPGPQGDSALTFVMNKWLSRNYNFGGKYQRNLNILALTKLIEHTILNEDERVAEVKILITSFTMSNMKHIETQPVLLKILKFLIHVLLKELEKLKKEALRSEERTCNIDSSVIFEHDDILQISFEAELSDSDGEWISDCDILRNSPDPLDMKDPIYNIKLWEYLPNFLKNVSKSNYFSKCIQFFNDTEKNVLMKIGINLNSI